MFIFAAIKMLSVFSIAQANCPSDGKPVLLTAIMKGYNDVADYLIQHGVDVNLQCEEGRCCVA